MFRSQLGMSTISKHPPLSRPLRGKHCISIDDHRALEFFSDRLSGLEVEHDDLLVIVGPNPLTLQYQRAIDTCGRSLKHIRLGLHVCTF